jgi:tRNA1(Val) A37 N6-methylase TrmN6
MVKLRDKWQFGDFQTPDELALEVCKTLTRKYKIFPQTIIEPSCGKGAFLRAAMSEFSNANILGFDINLEYVMVAKSSVSGAPNIENITIQQMNFFEMDWKTLISNISGHILILGNPPWVTSSELSALNSQNTPEKSNFQQRRGIESITGSGNFDISEWMLLQYIEWLSKRSGTIALLCKYAVARKVMCQIEQKTGNKFACSIYLIDAKAYFGAAVEACLFVLSTSNEAFIDCEIYESLQSLEASYSIGQRDGFILHDTVKYEKWRHLAGQNLKYLWRSGVKHDCSKVMELERIDNGLFQNGLGEQYVLEEEYLYPLLKSSDIGNSRTDKSRKLVLITQQSVGENTESIKHKAPQTWQYLQDHDEYLVNRKSSIYKNKPPYSIFGVGAYSFKPWKVAISGLYKRLNFCLVSPLAGKSVIFDDTVNFLSFETEVEARSILALVTATPALEFLDAMIFWDEKRPITIELLRRLSLRAVAQEIGMLAEYLGWAEAIQINHCGQLELGLAEPASQYIIVSNL